MDIKSAKGDAERAQSRLVATAKKLRAQLTPHAIAQRFLRTAKKQTRVTLLGAVASSKTRPLLAAGMIAAGTAYFLRKPIFTALAKRLPKETHDDQ